MQLYVTSNDLRKFILHGEKGEAGRMFWFEFHQHIDVAIEAKLPAQRRSKNASLWI